MDSDVLIRLIILMGLTIIMILAIRGGFVVARQKYSRKPQAKAPQKRVHPTFAVVTAEQAKMNPYPMIMVNSDGSARELHANERKYLETPFMIFDGATPYTKVNYAQKTPTGDVRGFMRRSELPTGIPIQPAPTEDPNPLKDMTPVEALRMMLPEGWELIENPDGTYTQRRKANPEA